MLINKEELGDTVPSIFSFFGGAKKHGEEEEAVRDMDARPTLMVKPQRNWMSIFGGETPTEEVVQTPTNPEVSEITLLFVY